MIKTRSQSLGEEIANSVTHGAAFIASLAAVPLLVLAAAGQRDPWQLVGGAIFGATMVLVFLMSTIYHALPASRAKRIFRLLDHSAIYLLIAGTYTPFMLGALRGPWGWSLLSIVWSLALLGIAAKVTLGFRYPRLSTAFYVGMGWLGVVALQPLLERVSIAGLSWLLVGGLCYTGGVLFYATASRVRYGHTLWHLCVVAGSACHFVAVLRYAAPAIVA